MRSKLNRTVHISVNVMLFAEGMPVRAALNHNERIDT